jgi:membrane protein
MINLNKKEFVAITKDSFRKWLSHNASLRAAALAFFIILPLPSLLLIITTVFAVFFGEEQAIQRLIEYITTIAGPAVAELVRDLLESARSPFTSTFASITSVGFTLGGAVGAFAIFHDTLNAVWEVPPQKRKGIIATLKSKVVPFLITSALGVLIIAWTGLTTVFFAIANFILEPITGGITPLFINVSQIALSFGLASFLFAIIYKKLPDTSVEWGDVTLATVMTALVFTITNTIFGFYIQTVPITTVIGAAGSLMILLLWIFLINQYILFGAEFSHTYAVTKGSRSKPNDLTFKLTKNEPEIAETMVKPFERFTEEIKNGLKETHTDIEVDLKIKILQEKKQQENNDSGPSRI